MSGLTTRTIDLDAFTANMVHEMFHAFQKEQQMDADAPNDLKMMMYPQDSDNYLLEQQENVMIANAIETSGQEKVELYCTILASRELRKKQIGEFIEQEYLIEQWERMAESCGMLALKQLNQDKYTKKLSAKLDERNDAIKLFMSKNRVRTKEEGFICGYAPMNQFRVGEKNSCKKHYEYHG